MKWTPISERKPKPRQRFLGADEKNNWNLFTTPDHDTIDPDDPKRKKVLMTKEQQLDKIIEVFEIVKWCSPNPAEEDILIAALEEIAEPVNAMIKRAEVEGNRINGGMAIQIANDPHYLRGIANKALCEIRG